MLDQDGNEIPQPHRFGHFVLPEGARVSFKIEDERRDYWYGDPARRATPPAGPFCWAHRNGAE